MMLMKIRLSNRYPNPYPSNPSDEVVDHLTLDADNHELILGGVVSMQFTDFVTIQFIDEMCMLKAKELTGWDEYNPTGSLFNQDWILEARTNDEEGKAMPAFVTPGYAWCDFFLTLDGGTAVITAT
jgi:hypothetical protein